MHTSVGSLAFLVFIGSVSFSSPSPGVCAAQGFFPASRGVMAVVLLGMGPTAVPVWPRVCIAGTFVFVIKLLDSGLRWEGFLRSGVEGVRPVRITRRASVSS